MGAAQQFLACGPPLYRGKHLYRDGDGWKHSNKRLHLDQIEQALQGQAEYGFYGASVSDCVALDLDDHSGGGWNGETPTRPLERLFRNVTGELSTPSLAFRSPRGIHVYYKLESMYPAPILTRLAIQKTHKFGAEVRPTMQMGLRFPRLIDRIHPETLRPIPDNGLQDTRVKFAGELFGMDHTDAVIREQVRNQSSGARGYSAQAAMIANVERKVLQDGLTGASNTALCNLAPVYCLAGLTLEQAVFRFELLTRDAGYSGELSNIHRLRQRMASLYRGFAENGFADTDRNKLQIQPGLYDAAMIRELVNQSPFARQREKPLERFLFGLFEWVNYQDAIKADPASMAVWNYLYPYHRHNVNRGWYPFPWSVLRRFNSDHQSIMLYLIESGFIIPAPFKYQVAGRTKDGSGYQAGVCKHYAVNRDPVLFS